MRAGSRWQGRGGGAELQPGGRAVDAATAVGQGPIIPVMLNSGLVGQQAEKALFCRLKQPRLTVRGRGEFQLEMLVRFGRRLPAAAGADDEAAAE